MDKTENNWCSISAGKYTGYVKTENLKTIGDQELISQELQQNVSHDHMMCDKAQQLEKQKERAGMLGKITLVLIVAAFILGGLFAKIRAEKTT